MIRKIMARMSGFVGTANTLKREARARTLKQANEGSRRPQLRVITQHIILSSVFVLVFMLLNRPEVIVINRLGSAVWYPATGVILALMLGVSPWYGVLVSCSVALAGMLIYDQPFLTFSGTVDAVVGTSFYAAAAYALRGAFQIDLGLRRRRDVVLYVSITSAS